jgi:hypothetical protein
MKLVIASLLFASSIASAASTHVDGHVRRDGTYVPPHFRTTPDSSLTNNYSTQGNYNPYTGREGTVNPYAPPSPSSSGFSNPYNAPDRRSGYR